MPRTEEGVILSDHTLDFVEWLQRCYDLLESGKEDEISSDPFFDSGLSDELIDQIIAAIDEEFEHELGTYPGYHLNRSGANALPEFSRLSPRGRRALVEGTLLIKRKHEALAAGQNQG